MWVNRDAKATGQDVCSVKLLLSGNGEKFQTNVTAKSCSVRLAKRQEHRGRAQLHEQPLDPDSRKELLVESHARASVMWRRFKGGSGNRQNRKLRPHFPSHERLIACFKCADKRRAQVHNM